MRFVVDAQLPPVLARRLETLGPTWLTEQVYQEQIRPRLAHVSVARMAAALGVSKSHAADICAGQRTHPRHWKALAELAAVTPK